MTESVDILAIAAHRDDVEQTCGGTLLKMAERGYRTAILDLTRGEMGTRGTVEDRAREADEARPHPESRMAQGLDIPDGRVENTYENRLKVARVIRAAAPARADPSLLAGASSRPRHRRRPRLRSGVPSPDWRSSTSARRRIARSRSSTPASTPMCARASSSTSPTQFETRLAVADGLSLAV